MSVHCEICGQDIGNTTDLLCLPCMKGRKEKRAREFHAHARERRMYRRCGKGARPVQVPVEFDAHEMEDGGEDNIYDRIKYLADHDGI